MVQVSGILHTIPSMHAGKKNHLLFVCCLLCTSPPLFFTGPFTAHTVLSHYKINPYLAHLIITKDIYYAASILVIFFVTVTIMDANNHLAFRNHAILFFQPRFDYYGINGRHPICCTVIKVYVSTKSSLHGARSNLGGKLFPSIARNHPWSASVYCISSYTVETKWHQMSRSRYFGCSKSTVYSMYSQTTKAKSTQRHDA